METRALGSQGLTVSAQGLGCMGMSQSYGEADEADVDRDVAPGPGARCDVLGHRERLRRHGAGGFGANERLLAQVLAEHRDEVTLATKMGIAGINTAADASTGRRFTLSATPGRGAAPLRGVAGPARHRPHRPLLPAPRRPGHPDRGVDRRDGRARAGRQGPPRRRVGGDRRGARARARDAPDHRAAERVVPVDPRPRGRGGPDRTPARHRAGAVLAAGSRLPHRRAGRALVRRRRRRAGRWRASAATTAPPTRRSSTRSRRWPRRTARCPRRSRWPGCTRRAPTSSRSPAPSGSSTSSRTSARLDIHAHRRRAGPAGQAGRPGGRAALVVHSRKFSLGVTATRG